MIKDILKSLLLCAALSASTAEAANKSFGDNATRKQKIGVIGQSTKAMTFGAENAVAPHHGQKKTVSPNSSLNGTSFGFLDGTDGMTWTYTAENTGTMYKMEKSHITVYDSNQKEMGQFTVEVPDDMVVNMIEPFGLVTKKLFDLNSNTLEVVVYLHQVGNAENNYRATDRLWVYSLNQGKVAEFIGDGMVVDASPNDWTTYQRLVLSKEDHNTHTTAIEVYRTPRYGEDSAVLEHTFNIDSNLISYTDGPFFNFANIDKEPYFVLCHYEKPFVEYDEDGNQLMNEENFMPFFTEDNSFVIETYDKNYNQISNFNVPCTCDQDRYLVRMNAFGAFSNSDLTKGYFSGDNKLNYIVMNEDVTITTEYVLSLDVYDQDGNKIKTIGENIGDNYKRLSDIKDMEEEWIFLNSEGTGLFAVDMPSCTRKEMPTTIDNYSISFNIDRIPADNEAGYEYIMGVNEATTDATQTNVIAMFAHLNPDFTTSKYTYINLGPNAQTFTPLVSEEGLNPYLFNTDDQREFLFFSKIKGEAGAGYNVLFLANEKGEVIETFGGAEDAAKGDIWTAMIMNYGSSNPILFINFYDWDNDKNTMEYYNLPLTKFAAGGDGTAENPYLISSVGDLAQIKAQPGANYKLAHGFNAYGYPVAIESFSGTIDGDGYTISNLDVTSKNYYGGLFGTIEGGTVKNLNLYAPTADATTDNQHLGILSGFTMNAKIENVNTYNAKVDVNHGGVTPVGTLIGQATAETSITNCYLVGTELNAKARTVGGIVGETRTGSGIYNCAVSQSTIQGTAEVGGFVGVHGNGCIVTDCSADRNNVYGNSYVGSIAGRCGVNSARAYINKCIVSGSVNATSKTAVGGIAGNIEPDWQKEEAGLLSSNATINLSIMVPETEEVGTVHRIAGMTITDEAPTRSETCMKWNYVYTDDTLAEGSYLCTCDDDTSAEGKDLEAASLTNQEFWTSLGYQFGETTDAPWVMEEGLMPRLYIETEANIPSSIRNFTAPQKPALQGIFNIQGQRLNAPTHGINIINGKKVIK